MESSRDARTMGDIEVKEEAQDEEVQDEKVQDEEVQDEEAVIVSGPAAASRSKPYLDRERPHMILPDGWLETMDSAIIEQGEKSDKICFGMVTNLGFKALTEGTSRASSKPTRLRLSSDNKFIRLEDDHSQELGELQQRTAEILRALSVPNISLQLFTTPRRSQKEWVRSQTKRKIRTEKFVSFSLIVYGPMELCKAVGEFASECDIKLQDPTAPVRDTLYRNPHLLMEPDEELLWTSTILKANTVQEVEIKGRNESSEALSEVLRDFFPESYELDETEAPSQIKTQLMSHQKKALTFLLEREKLSSFDTGERYSWFRKVHDSDGISYANTITGKKQTSIPPSCLGGLFADDMGLGKSLTMISLIASAQVIDTDSSPGGPCPIGLQKSFATLIVVPSLPLIHSWENEFDQHIHLGSLCWAAYHGSRRTGIDNLITRDVVLTTYQTLISEFKKIKPDVAGKMSGRPPPYGIFWRRIVLDEAHVIRNEATSSAKAVCALQGERRWAVTGTPVQNSLNDLASIFEFLGAHPFDNRKTFQSEIANPILHNEKQGAIRLKALMGAVALRRTNSMLDLRSTIKVMISVEFSDAERRAYHATQVEVRDGFKEAKIGARSTEPKFGFMIQAVFKLRQICNHGLLTKGIGAHNDKSTKPWNSGSAQEAFLHLLEIGEVVCSHCGRDLSVLSVEEPEQTYHELSRCLSIVCDQCAAEKTNVGCPHDSMCPSHRVYHPLDEASTPASSGPEVEDMLATDRMPSKIKALTQNLCKAGTEVKSVVFSAWIRTLELIESNLNHIAIRCITSHGGLTLAERNKVLEQFRNDPAIQVLLISFGTAFGTNLTVASAVHIVEPPWNPLVEEQAISRVVRLGQTEPVKIFRYRINGSIEEFVSSSQMRKKRLSSVTLGDKPRNIEELSKVLLDL